jgi:hypothetical protein
MSCDSVYQHFPHRLTYQDLGRKRSSLLLKQKIQLKKNNTSHLNLFWKCDSEYWLAILGSPKVIQMLQELAYTDNVTSP